MLWIILLLFLMLARQSCGQSTYYVTPNTTVHCPGEPCYDLTTYVLNSSRYFHSGSTFVFLAGVHQLENDAIFHDIFNLELRGSNNCVLEYRTVSSNVYQYGFDPYSADRNIGYYQSSAQIVCGNSSGLAFVNVANLTLKNLTMFNCGSTFSFAANMYHASGVYLYNITNLVMNSISVQNGTGFGLRAVNVVGDVRVIGSSFIANNQYVKDLLQRTNIDNFPCEGQTKMYVNNGSADCSKLRGGNVFFFYNTSHRAILAFNFCVFALGVDATISTAGLLNDACSSDSVATGLSIKLKSDSNVSVSINATVLYRNQGAAGSNFYFSSINALNGIVLTVNNISSMNGIGTESGISIFSIQTNKFTIGILTNSTFMCNYVPLSYQTFIAGGVLITNSTFNSSSLVVGENNTLNDCFFINSNYSQFSSYCKRCLFKYSNFYANDEENECISCVLDDSMVNAYGSNRFEDCVIRNSIVAISYGKAYHNGCVFDNSKITAISSNIFLRGTNAFKNTVAQLNGGAMALYTSTLLFEEGANVTFSNNVALTGGAIYMDGLSHMNFTFGTTEINVSFVYNKALLSGGAIFADMPYSGSSQHCYFNFYNVSENYSWNLSLSLYFEGNAAADVGSVLYGGSKLCVDDADSNVIGNFMNIYLPDPNKTYFASDPIIVSQCNCNNTEGATAVNLSVYPGQTIQLSLVTMDPNNNVVPGIVLIYNNSSSGFAFISTFRTSISCDIYSIVLPKYYATRNGSSTFQIATQMSLQQQLGYSLTLTVQELPCPPGFVLNEDNPSPFCMCVPLLARYGGNCDINNLTLIRSGNMWIGYITNDDVSILGVADSCPYDFCNYTDNIIPVDDLSSQCAYNRTGVLCGQCQDGLSMTFGTSQCKSCSNYNLLLIVVFALMGLALVAFLFLLNITVSSGTLYGLIFYANIISTNDNVFLPRNHISISGYVQFVSIFISWLNLDFGIETCFYNGMDSYAKTWLQFAFPTYVFGLVGIIIFAGRRSSKISNWRGFKIAVPVLATLILLSFSKLLRTIITIFSFSRIDTWSTIFFAWSYDGNLKYFEWQHEILFALGIMMAVFFILPYTLLLLFLQCLQSRSNWRPLRWVNYLKPFLDCYAGPFKDRYRYWSGVLIGVRFPLYLLYASSYSINVRLLGTAIAIFLYSVLIAFLSVYRSWYHLLLEMFFHLNLFAIVMTTLFDPSPNTSLPVFIIVQILLGCVFACFVAIIIRHIMKVVPRYLFNHKKTLLWRSYEEAQHYEDTTAARAHVQSSYGLESSLNFDER